MDAGKTLRAARRRARLSQRRLAEKAGLPQSTVARIEAGGVVPRVDTLDRLLRICGRSLEARPRLGIGVDRTLIQEMLRLSPAERVRVAGESAKNLSDFKGAVRK